jgi:hypothetical protein
VVGISGARVVARVDRFQLLAIDMGIDLSGVDAGMAQQVLQMR